MTQDDVDFMKRWMKNHPDELFPMSLVYLYPKSWRDILELIEMGVSPLTGRKYKVKKND